MSVCRLSPNEDQMPDLRFLIGRVLPVVDYDILPHAQPSSLSYTFAGLSNSLCEAPPRPFFCECAVSGSARHGTLTYFFWGGAAFAEGSWRELESPVYFCADYNSSALA